MCTVGGRRERVWVGERCPRRGKVGGTRRREVRDTRVEGREIRCKGGDVSYTLEKEGKVRQREIRWENGREERQTGNRPEKCRSKRGRDKRRRRS